MFGTHSFILKRVAPQLRMTDSIINPFALKVTRMAITTRFKWHNGDLFKLGVV
jgi:hypothetical protein